ncbi:helix-turn-helix domain-containing protein [Streptacidiphilus sp. P02-A3a]|uniref:helix-turn-helix domain-containing protein n=1 Tax=Streptacidiphilus sp. P02-A3a TaxID=2704468 RepID=UPI00351A01F5
MRIARYRKLRHLTQRGLATAACVSYSMVFQVEQGRKQPSPALLAAFARILSVSVADLAGQPFLAELQQDQLDGLINPIREALDVYDLGADPDITPPPPGRACRGRGSRVCPGAGDGSARSGERTAGAAAGNDDRSAPA